jgi:hypothetical protein
LHFTPALLSLGALSGCMGSWAQDTHVAINPTRISTVHGDAEIAQSTNCARRCSATGGSDILLTLDGVKSSKIYVVLLMHGDCAAPPRSGVIIADEKGADLRDRGERVHVETPIHQLVKTDYSIVVTDSARATALACGPIKSDAPY